MKKDMKEYEYYNNVKKWDFDSFDIVGEYLTDWDMYKILNDITNSNSKVLDLGTGGGEKVLKYYSESLKEIVATDFSSSMIETANRNLKNSKRKNVTFKVMDNLNMDVCKNYFDVVVARNTVIDPKQIYNVLKKGGYLIVRGVDKYDCYELKKLFGFGQGFFDSEPISITDYNNIVAANFKEIELVNIYKREYFKSEEELYKFLNLVPILKDMDNDIVINYDIFKSYINNNKYLYGIRLNRRYYGIIAKKV